MPIIKRVRLRLGSVQHLKSKFGDGYTLQFRAPAHRAAGPGAHGRVRLIQNWFCGGVGAIRGPSFFPLYYLNLHIVSFFRRRFADYTVVFDCRIPCPCTEVSSPKSQVSVGVYAHTFPIPLSPSAPGRNSTSTWPTAGRPSPSGRPTSVRPDNRKKPAI